MRLEKNPDAVRSRNRLKKATPAACSGFALAGQAMSSSTPVRSAAAQATKVLPYRSSHSWSSQASPPRTGVCRSGSSPSMKSMNSGTAASVALPERSSLGMIRSTSTRTVSHSWAVNCFGSYGVPRASASRARADASRTDSGVHRDAAGGDAVPLFGARHRRERLTPHLRDERPEGLLHVLHLLVLVVGPLPVEPRNGDAPPVHRVRVDLAVGVVVGDHLAAAREADRGAVVAAGVVLAVLCVAPSRPGGLQPVQDALRRQGTGAPAPDVVAAREVELRV